MKIITLIYCSLSSIALLAQQKVCVKLSPLASIDHFTFPTIQAGIEIKLNNHFAWYSEFGIKYRKCLNEISDTFFVVSDGFKAKTELRYYPNKQKESTAIKGQYYAANVFFTRDFHNTQIKYYYQNDSSKVSVDAFGVQKDVVGVNLVYGYQEVWFKHLALDVYAGLGVRVRQVMTQHKEFEKDRDKMLLPVDFNFVSMREGIDANGGMTVIPSLTLSFRIGYLF